MSAHGSVGHHGHGHSVGVGGPSPFTSLGVGRPRGVYRQRSRSFDSAFLAQLQTFHRAQPMAYANGQNQLITPTNSSHAPPTAGLPVHFPPAASPPRAYTITPHLPPATTVGSNGGLAFQQAIHHQLAAGGHTQPHHFPGYNAAYGQVNHSPFAPGGQQQLQQQYALQINQAAAATAPMSPRPPNDRNSPLPPAGGTFSMGAVSASPNPSQSRRERQLREVYLSPRAPVVSTSAGVNNGGRSRSGSVHTVDGSPRSARSMNSSPRIGGGHGGGRALAAQYLHAGVSPAGGLSAGAMPPALMDFFPMAAGGQTAQQQQRGMLPPVAGTSPRPPKLSDRMALLTPVSPKNQQLFGWGADNLEAPSSSAAAASSSATVGPVSSSAAKKDRTSAQLHTDLVVSSLSAAAAAAREDSPTSAREKKTAKEASSAKKKLAPPPGSPLPSLQRDSSASNVLTSTRASSSSSSSSLVNSMPTFSTITETMESRDQKKRQKEQDEREERERERLKKLRVAQREQAALAKVTDQEVEKQKMKDAEEARLRRDKAEQSKQRKNMAEEGRRRAKQLELKKKGEEVLEELEEKRRAQEAIVLARLRAQHPVSLFNPTLAYALKVESSHSKARRPMTTAAASVAAAAAATSSTSAATKQDDEKTSATQQEEEKTALTSRLYDGADWDELKELEAAAAATNEESDGDADGAGGEEEDQVEDMEESGLLQEDDGDDDAGAGEDTKPASRINSLSSVKSPPTTTTTAKPPKTADGNRRAHARSLSTVAREHIASQFTKIEIKHEVASKVIRARKKRELAQRQQIHQLKAQKSDSIRLAREAELKRMQAAMDASLADQAQQAKVDNYVLAMKLAKAAKEGDCERIKALSADPAETQGDLVRWVNRHDSAGSTAIFHATWTAALPALELLFRLGAEPNQVNNRKNTALHLACDRLHYPVIQLLISAGANPLLKNHERNAPFEMQSKASNESLEMALFLRQCLEDVILEKADDTTDDAQANGTAGIGMGMANVVVVQPTEDDSGGAIAEETAASFDDEPAPVASPTPTDEPGPASTLVAGPLGVPSASSSRSGSRASSPMPGDRPKTSSTKPPSSSSSKRKASGASDVVLVSNARAFLSGINEYIAARIQALQSLRRTKVKIWTAIRFSRGSTPRVSTDIGAQDQEAAAALQQAAAETNAGSPTTAEPKQLPTTNEE